MDNNIWTIVIPSLVTVVGFFINYRVIYKEKKLEIYKYKNQEQIQKLIDIPQKLLLYIDNYMKLVANQQIQEGEFEQAHKDFRETTFCYGSEDAVAILSFFEQRMYLGVDDKTPVSPVEFIAPLVLLICQLKFDITGIKTSPKIWYVRFISQKMLETGFCERSVEEINNIVERLHLQDFLKIENMAWD